MDLESIPPPLPPPDEEEVVNPGADSYDSDLSNSVDSDSLAAPTALNARRTIRLRDYKDAFTKEEIKTIGNNLSTDTTLKKLVLVGSQEIDRTVAYHLGQGLRTNTTLEVLVLQDCNLDEKSTIMLANGLQFNNHLQVLVMKDNVDITPIAAEKLFRALARGGGNLVRLNYSNNSLFEDRGYKRALFWLSNMLCVTTSLKRLDLADTMLQSLQPLSVGLKANTTLRSLNLKWSTFEDEPNRFFWQEWLSLNGTLQSLILAQCGIDEELAVYLADGLAVNTSLTHLDLSSNEFQASGCCAIAQAVKSNKKLRILDLGWNQLDDGVGPDIADMIQYNTSLTVLSLSNNPLGEQTLDHIAGAMKKNRSIKTLLLEQCEFGDNGWLKCMEMLLVNNSLTQFHMCRHCEDLTFFKCV